MKKENENKNDFTIFYPFYFMESHQDFGGARITFALFYNHNAQLAYFIYHFVIYTSPSPQLLIYCFFFLLTSNGLIPYLQQLFKYLSLMRKEKYQATGSSNHIHRIKKYQDYFDAEKTYFMTPHSRSLPKKKTFFKQVSKQSNQKPKQRRQSINLKNQKSKKKQASPDSKHKPSRFDHSINRQYDSPSRDNQELDFILAERPINKRTGNLIQITIDKVYEELTKNNLNQAIDILKGVLSDEPHNYDLNYLLGVCHLLNGSYEQAINIFDVLLGKKPRKNIYLLLSVCYKKMEDYEQTQKILNECLKKNPKSYQTHIYRGKLYLKLKKYREALNDFERAIKISPEKQIGYIGKGDCLRLYEKYEEAKTFYAKALNLVKKINPSILLRRAICNMQLKRYEPAFDDIQELLIADPENSQALYFKGLIYNKQKMQNEAIICYEQAIKFNTNKKAVTRSIYQLAKIKIQHRDYYEALYTLERAKFLDIQEKVIRKFKVFADGVTQLMKKNFQTGIKILSELIEGNPEKPIGNFLKPLVYSSRSYGYMSLSKFQQAKEDLQRLENQYSLDIPNLYNKFICQGIMACNSQKYEQSLAFFSKAGKIMPSKVQPFYYKAVTLLCFISKLIPKDMKTKQREYLESAMKTINKCEKKIENNPSLHLVRSFIYYALGEAQKSLEDLDKCMSQSLKHESIHFYLNGLILAEHYGRYQEAIQQFNKALKAESDHKIPQIYLNKAKCLLLLRQINLGFVDLQTYMSFRPSSPEIHIWAGHLLFYIGASQDAAKAYSNISNISRNPEVLLYRAKCYLNSKNVIDTLSNLKQILDTKYDNRIFFDFHVLDALRECSEQAVDYAAILCKIKQAKQRSFNTGEGKFGYFVKEAEYQFYKAILYFHMEQYETAGKNFERALKLTQLYIAQKSANSPDLLEFYKLSYDNIPFNYVECLYNLTLCEIMNKNIMKGVKRIKIAIDKCPESDTKNQLQLFAHMLENEIRNQFDRRKPQNQDQFAQLDPFPYQNRLCSIFPQFKLQNLSTNLRTRLYFCLPGVEKPDIKPKFDQKLYDEINMSTIQIKPQAPWIKRSEEGVIFTDDVVGCDVQLSESSGSEEQENNERQEDEIEEPEGHEEDEEHYDENDDSEGNYSDGNDNGGNGRPVMMNPAQLKTLFKLDPKVEAKLAKLK